MEQNIFDVADDFSFPWLPAYAAESPESDSANALISSGCNGNGANGPVSSGSSRMLETIVEETSDDDGAESKLHSLENNSISGGWSQYDQVWSSAGSDTGSVIRVDTPSSDQDAMSERDFICPAKRRKQDNDNGNDELDGEEGEDVGDYCGAEDGGVDELLPRVLINGHSYEDRSLGDGAEGTANGAGVGGSNHLGVFNGRRPRFCEVDGGMEVTEYFMRRPHEPSYSFELKNPCLGNSLPPSGVPQGSHLGPIIFIIYFNNYSRFSMAQDDIDFLHQQFSVFALWWGMNCLPLNRSKCSVILFSLKRNTLCTEYILEDETITRVDHINDPGVILDQRLEFKTHTNYVVDKASRNLRFLFRTPKDFKDVYCLESPCRIRDCLVLPLSART
ncbi:uncharacterized protein LOC129741596 [Uranotaenia lowii]|uniref:uncharacterized protein LOC129741596 n=1 Tax=Uranotaenia lowii TaxID=190385 RepID=UPI002479AFBC|nr:uncharacterized protein LOC129741596 [Uranotaenia lowii]